jgi:uncharacterized protein
MAKVVLLLVLVGVILWWVGARVPPRHTTHSARAREPEAFTRCAHCGVHLPHAEALVERDLSYCSEAHRLAGPRDRKA